MKMRKLLAIGLSCIGLTAAAQNNPLWLRYPSISPDGKTILFGYKGDIYRVDAQGGTAVPLTIHEAQDMMPVWSHDGKTIAFASDRYGNFDVFVMPATGGAPTRVTNNSANDYPYDFTTDDKKVIFGSGRTAPATSVRFNSPRLFQNLYSVAVTGGRPVLISAAGMENAHYNSKGTQLIFQDRKGYEDAWRKHHTSAVTRDIWVMDIGANSYRKLTSFEGEDREPVFSSDDQSFYYLNEKDGTQNLYKASLTAGASEQQLTKFKDNPVRHLSRSSNNTLCFSWNGEIYTLQNDGTPKKVSILIANDGRGNVEKNIPINGNVTEFTVSPNGKEIAFVNRGEVFVTSVEGGQTKRITNTPSQERMIEWSPDGKTLLYSAERNNSWDIYQATIVRKDEPYFYAATLIKEEPLIATDAEEFQPKFSPDGKEVAYVEERNILKVYNLASKKTRTLLPAGHNHSYSDGDWSFQWSPDSKWIITDDQRNYFFTSNTGLIKADGSQAISYPVNSGFGEGSAKWALDGKMLTWTSDRDGRRSLAVQGSREVDVFGVFFDKEQYDRFKLSKEELALLKEKEEKKDTTKKDDKKTKEDSKTPLVLNLDDLDNRRVKLTINSSSISDYILSKDGSKLYYLSSFEKGFDLWVTEPRTHDTRILAKLGGSPSGLEVSKDGKSLFASNRGGLVKIDAESGKVTPIGISGDMVLDAAAERSYIYEHTWRQVQKKFYDPAIHGINWKGYHDTYARFLPHISNNYDFQELLSELLGELNGSHTGGRYSPRMANADVTASLGLLYDESYTGNGLKVTEVISGGPLDKAGSKIKAGTIIEKIDGEAITDNIDWAKLLNQKADKNTLLSVKDGQGSWDETVKPITIGEENALLYTRWVDKMTKMVDKLSNGQIGYVHVQGMNDGSFREVFDKVMGRNLEKKALIVDTRFNGGGWLHDDLNTFLSGKTYLRFAPQGNIATGGEPVSRWQKPSCVLMSEGNYSDAFIFPYIYKQNAIGKLVGMPVAGTGTAVWWEQQIDPTIVFGIPMVATIGKENRPTENLQVEPDIKVTLPYEDFLNGKDDQLEAAVKEMLKEVK
ncbi:C-terminal processing protease CtpA/Prc, contains a PDZ domain [Filimonas lacunae]|uniref:Tricorn protease homolog n=1 Tax=Filimonas lacunae TaxID=477680 RepID=A0A173MNB9_9BACT|nr:S41 family peptidase [Filimonas lacunae]BAV09134.1 tolB protein precursor, periplasmic protein [Filimonas lacunae]SIS67765.1 C-terminal processing protease CtpA/Prc, contains a PDZ domain [Filimonas lacunae]